MWCQVPDDDDWVYLSQRYPIKSTAHLFEVATSGYTDRNLAGLIAFCVRHGLAPEEPVRRAEFYALTAADPDRLAAAAARSAAARDYQPVSCRSSDRTRPG
jgi:hypothetical protein